MRTRGRALFVASLIGNLLAGLALVLYLHHAGLQTVAVKLGLSEPPTPDFAALARTRFAGLPGARIVILGDSQAADGPYDEIIHGVARRGIGGATIRQVTSMMPPALYPQTKRLIVEAGTNDALQGRTSAQIRTDYLALVAEAHRLRPDVTVTFLTVPPPVGLGRQVAEVNRILTRVGEETGTPVVDIAPPLVLHGETDPKFTLDGTHLNGAGFAAIAPELREAARVSVQR